MRLIKLLLLTLSIISFGCESQTVIPRIEIVEPNIEQEATSIWRTINDIDFFEEQGYNINIPKGDVMY